MTEYIYHYYAIYEVNKMRMHVDGVYKTLDPIKSYNDYIRFKKQVVEQCKTSFDKLSICSLSLLSSHTNTTNN